MLANIIRNRKKTGIGGGGGGIVIESDPYYGYTSLLLHMDGSNASTNFVDSGPNALAVTAVGNAQVSTAQSKYGGASGSVDGTGDYLSISDSSAPVLGSSDWTIEAWIYISVAKSYNCIYAKRPPGGYGFGLQVDGANNLSISASTTGSSWALAGSSLGGGYTAGSWIHVAVVRSGNTITGYKNGVSTGTQTLSGTIWPSTGYAAAVASGLAGDTSQDFNGYIDDLRITKYARYQSSFTPPTQALPNIYNPYASLPVSGAALWLDASQQSSLYSDAGFTPVTTSGQSIYQWNDLSGNNRHAVQATSGNRPTWVPPASGQNGLGVANFNGSNNFFVGQWQNFTDLTLFIVARNTNAYSPGGRMFSQSDDTYADNVQTPTTTYIPAAVASTSQFLSTNISQQAILSVSFPNNTYQRFIHRRTGTTGSNTVGSTTTAGTIGTVTRNMTRYCMGRNTNGTDGNWAGQICEVIAFPRQLTSGEEASINSYLNTKWGTP